MIARLARSSMFALAALALSGAVALSQAPPAATPPDQSASPGATPQAPIERRPAYSQFHRGPGQNGPGQRNGNFNRARMMHKHGNFRGGPGGGFHGRQEGGFRGPEGGGMDMAGGLRMGPGGMWWKNPMVVQRLTLTADQTKRMDDIFQRSRLELIDLRAKVETQNAILEPLLSATPFDSAKALAQIDRVADARAELEKADARMLIGIRGVLTPDQWTKLHDHQGPGGFSRQGGPGGEGGPAAGGPGGGRGQRGGGPPPSANNLVDPIDLP